MKQPRMIDFLPKDTVEKIREHAFNQFHAERYLQSMSKSGRDVIMQELREEFEENAPQGINEKKQAQQQNNI